MLITAYLFVQASWGRKLLSALHDVRKRETATG
jgi:hypothetical protein